LLHQIHEEIINVNAYLIARPLVTIIIIIKYLFSLKCFVLLQGRHTNEMSRIPDTREPTFARN